MMASPKLSGLSILVVEGDSKEASDLRSELISFGAKVHVVANSNTALMIASRKRIHGAILHSENKNTSSALFTHLAMSAVPFTFYGGPSGRTSNDAANSMADLISVEAQSATHERRRKLQGSGDDRRFSII